MEPIEPTGISKNAETAADMLRELDLAAEEVAALVPITLLFSRGHPLEPSVDDIRRLMNALLPALLPYSPTRAAIHAHQQQHGSGLSWLLTTARTQVSLFGLAFWLVSALVTLVGALAVMGKGSDHALLLHASGPFLAFWGTVIAFRGVAGRVLECELVCPPTPMQLTMARLVIVLGYDLNLGLALGLLLWVSGSSQVMTLLFAWFMPLLFVAGLALLLSLRLPAQIAASLAYGGWLSMLAINATPTLHLFALNPLSDALLGSLGLILLTMALLRLQFSMHHLLPRF